MPAPGSAAPLLSVVVPFHGVERYLGACLDSLRAQVLTDLEVILVDDGSPDGSRAVAQRVVDVDPRFRLVTRPNGGLGPARNTGAALARGRYLTFVDSDDLVAPRAYSLLVGSLERTGSEIAAGGACRFGGPAGAVRSWTHEAPFARDEAATDLHRRPDLATDQMVWNKVYRRRFWEENGLAFPAIRYEDYPVTLRAYLRARSVDVHAEHVYWWRERESGDSITQQVADAGNAADRHRSALLVLQVLDEADAAPAVRSAVEGRLVNVDLTALARAWAAAPPAVADPAAQAATDLARRIDPASAGAATPPARLLHLALRHGDLDLVRRLVGRREGGGPRALAAALARRPRPDYVLPAVRATVGSRRLTGPGTTRPLRARATSLRWEGDALVVDVDAAVHPRLAGHVRAAAALVRDGRRLPVAVRTVGRAGGTVRTRVRVPAAEPAAAGPGRWVLELGLSGAGLRWRGPARTAPALLPGPVPTPTGWVQPGAGDGHLGVELLPDAVVVRQVHVAGAAVRLETDPAAREARVRRPEPSGDVPLPPDGPATPLAALVADDPADDPVTRVAERPVVAGDDTRPCGWFVTAPPGRVPDPPPPSLRGRVLLAGEGASGVVGPVRVSLVRGRDGGLVVRQEPAAP